MRTFRSNFLAATYGLTALICLGTAVAALGRKKLEWTEIYVPAGARLLAGANLYPPGTGFTYPPFTAFIAIPFAWIPVWLSTLIFHLLNFAAMILIVRCSWRIAGGLSLPKDEKKFKHEIWIALLAVLCALRFSFNALSHGQSDLLIGLLLIVGAASLIGGRSTLAGVCWGLGAAFKGPPLLLVGYLLWRRYTLAALTMLAVFLAASLLPDLIHHAPPGKTWLMVWIDRYVQPLLHPQHTMGEWGAGLLDNQSISGAANRWLNQSIRIEGKEIVFSLRPDAIRPGVAKAIVYSTYALLGIVSAMVMWPPFRSFSAQLKPAGEGDRPYSIHPYAWEVSIAFCLILLVSPMSSRAHFCTLMLPAMCLARAAISSHDRVARACLFTAITLSLVSYNLGVFTLVNRITLYLGFVTLATLSLLIGCWWVRWKSFR